MSPETLARLRPATLVGVAAALVVAVSGCASDDSGGLSPPGDSTVWMELSEGDGDDKVVEILFLRPADGVGPRVVELVIDRPETLELVAAEAGEAATAAGKNLTTQEPSPASIRLILLATGNLLEIDSGVLVRLTLRGSGTLSFDASVPTFAPKDAEPSARLGPALQI